MSNELRDKHPEGLLSAKDGTTVYFDELQRALDAQESKEPEEGGVLGQEIGVCVGQEYGKRGKREMSDWEKAQHRAQVILSLIQYGRTFEQVKQEAPAYVQFVITGSFVDAPAADAASAAERSEGL